MTTETSTIFCVKNDQILLNLKVVPGSSSNKICNVENDRVKIKIASQPENGKANAALIGYFSNLLGCAKKEVSIKSGEKSRLKVISLPLEYKETLMSALKF
ncbi:MAG: DUF167 domain-containing protein [Spirochaetaceae bacterium]|jgi:uncharacterized protein (TIGR00251 family)|nr:DUF167 domain-containing protein [Spirochaetaceae bacterium]